MGAGAALPTERVDVRSAAEGGHLEVLKWARAHDLPWNEMTCSGRANGGAAGGAGAPLPMVDTDG